ncbi:hypothetical protein BC834DRAFT_870921 [Gloeopeniophorella convolvens]|nr:hypothetical protein BC834DRAFT_870921 [Gloeopeniophorella convolvens]
MEYSPEHQRRPQVSLPGIRTLFPDHLLSATPRHHQPTSAHSPVSNVPRMFTEQSARPLPSSENTSPTNSARPEVYERRLQSSPSSEGYRHVMPPCPPGYTSSTAQPTNSSASLRSPYQLYHPSTSFSQPPAETARLHPVGSRTLSPRSPSPTSTISENESPGSEPPSPGDLSADENPSPTAADRQSDGGRRHACPHCAKRFNRPSSLAIHVNTHTGDKPFKCPFPGCGREFNVNSNMRRHYRKHLTSAAPQAPRPGAFYSPPASTSAGLQFIRYHDYQTETYLSTADDVSPIDPSDPRASLSKGTRWRPV